MIKIIIRLIFTACILTIGGMFYFLTLTTTGLKTELAILNYFLPQKLLISHIEGSLFYHFTLKNITYRDTQTGIDLNVDAFTVRWQPKYLLGGKLFITDLILQNGYLIIHPNSKNTNKNSNTNINFHQLTQTIKSIQHHVVIKKLSLTPLQITFQQTILKISGALTDQWQFTWQGTIPSLTAFSQRATGKLVTSGSIQGALLTPTIKITLAGNSLQFDQQKIKKIHTNAQLLLQPNQNSSLSIETEKIKINNFTLNKLAARLTSRYHVAKNKIFFTTQLTLQQPHKNNIIFLSTILFDTHKSQKPIKIQGNLSTHFSLSDLPLPTIDFIKQLRGQLTLTSQLTGTLTHPIFTHHIQLTEGALQLPLTGTRFNAIRLNATINSTYQCQFSGTFTAGSGLASLNGTFDPQQSGYPFTLQLKGEHLQSVQLPFYSAVLSPDLTLRYADNLLTLTGNLRIPTASIQQAETSHSTITLTNDVVFADPKKSNTTLPFRTALQLNVQLGNTITVNMQGLKTKLGGQLHIQQVPNGAITAIGELFTHQGNYRAYGQTLTIQTGRLIYTGGLITDPGLNIKAIKKIRSVAMTSSNSSFTGSTGLSSVYDGAKDIIVGVRVTGTLNAPQVTLFSEPSMSQANIMSYLVFGYPQSGISSHQAGTLFTLLSSVGPTGKLSGISSIQDGLAQKLGLNEIGLESTQVFNPTSNGTVSTTTLTMGRQLAPKLSLHYSVGLFYPVSILNLRYKLSQRWTLQSENSTIDNGADLLFSIEKD